MGANSGQIIKLFFILSTMCCIYFFNFYFQIKYIVFFVLIIYWLYLKCHTWHLAVLILSFFWKLWSCMSLWKCIMYNVPKLNRINKYLSFFLLIWIHFLMSEPLWLSLWQWHLYHLCNTSPSLVLMENGWIFIYYLII